MTTQEQWTRLYELYKDSDFASLSLSLSDVGVNVIEKYGSTVVYDYTRFFNGSRNTSKDLTGMVGFSLIDFTKPSVILTEGISDFLTLKSFRNDLNVIGRTRLSLSQKQHFILTKYFSNFVVVMDNDLTGLKNGMNLSSKLHNVKLLKPPYPYKDITEFLLNSDEQDCNNFLNSIERCYQ